MVSAGARLFVTGLVLLFSCAGAQRIAIIGGAVSGSFTAKYLADYDTKCTVDIHVFEPYPVREPTRPSDTPDVTWYPDETWQGSRVETLKLSDGATIELGASIAHDGNPLVKAMIEGDPELDFAQPFSTGSDEDRPEGGFGIFGGTSWPLPPEDGHTFWRKLKLVLRYNNDLRKVLKASQIAEDSFSSVVFLLNSTEPHTFFPSPDAIWREVGLYKAVHTSFARFLDMIGIREKPGILRRLLPFQGNFREEFLTAINLVNYNQNVKQVNAAVGLASFSAAMGDLFCIEGGNYRLIPSSLKQTKQRRDAQGCSPVQEIERRVTTVVGSLDGFKMYSGQEELGKSTNWSDAVSADSHPSIYR
jgi:prenylcysteine oxidase/farnesylcysteine lyase